MNVTLSSRKSVLATCIVALASCTKEDNTPSATSGDGGATHDVSSVLGTCSFTIDAKTADTLGPGGLPTVGVVQWTVDATDLTSASIEFGLPNSPTLIAPVDIALGSNFRTLLLGMKGSSTYGFTIKVSGKGFSCISPGQTITTGAVPNDVFQITRTLGEASSSQARGFIIGSSGIGALTGGSTGVVMPGAPPSGVGVPELSADGGLAGVPLDGGFPGMLLDGGVPAPPEGFPGVDEAGSTGSGFAVILDADADPVWWSTAPTSCSRAKMSADGQYMWMVNVNAGNAGGEVMRVSMDGLTRHANVPGLSNCHHDITVLPNDRVACLSWTRDTDDLSSDILESDYLGNVTKVAHLGADIYVAGSSGALGAYHANSIHYHPTDDTYTIGDRNPNLYVKITHDGQPVWQFGGSCVGAKAPHCIEGDWSVNHGHDLLDDGTFLIFSNGASGAATALFYQVTSGDSFSASRVGTYSPGSSSTVLGDVFRLPNGNTLVAFSTASRVDEIDADGKLVQTVSGLGGYVEWRETLYGAPLRY